MGTPTGVGILYGKKKWLNKLTPTSGGGDMAKKVTFNSFVPEKAPKKFEAGTSSFADIIAMGTLIDYVKEIDIRKTAKYEQQLLAYATEELGKIPGLLIYGSAPKREPVISFRIKGQDVKKLEKYLSEEHNIFTRAGDLTAQPLMKILGVKELLRVSFCYYNTFREIDTLVRVIRNYIGK
jgi:cysteine desulfurase / selenocysteine lyase